MTLGLRKAGELTKDSWGYLEGDRAFFAAVVLMSLSSAFVEGLGVALLVPVLQAIGNQSLFSNVPVLNHVDTYFIQFTPSQRLQFAAIGMLGIYLFRGLFVYSFQVFGFFLSLRVSRRLRRRSFDALLKANMRFISKHNVGEIINSLSGYGSRVGQAIVTTPAAGTLNWQREEGVLEDLVNGILAGPRIQREPT